jgi:hypothetical protein
METYYASSTHGRIPLSQHGKRLMHKLRCAIQDSVRKGYYTYYSSEGSVGYTRGELALYMGQLEREAKELRDRLSGVTNAMRGSAELQYNGGQCDYLHRLCHCTPVQPRVMCNADIWPRIEQVEAVQRWYSGSRPWHSFSGGPANLQNLPRADGAVPPFKNFRKVPRWKLEQRPTSTASDTIEWPT